MSTARAISAYPLSFLRGSANAEVKRPRKRKRAQDKKRKEEKKEEVEESWLAKSSKVTGSDDVMRSSTPAEVAERVAGAVYALSSQHIQHCWHHTLNGKTLMKEAQEGHAKREREGTQMVIPKTKKRKKREAEDERRGDEEKGDEEKGDEGKGDEGEVGEEIMQMQVKEEEMLQSLQVPDDDLQVVVCVYEEQRGREGEAPVVINGLRLHPAFTVVQM